jgi:hypothetical protein
MNERIKELAEQIIGFEAKSSSLTFSPFELERFAELVRQEEREACALLCDSRKEFYGHSPMYAYLIRGRTE